MTTDYPKFGKLEEANGTELDEMTEHEITADEVKYDSTNSVQDKLNEQLKVGARLGNFTNFIPTGWSGAIPLDTTKFKTVASMHDATVGDSGTATGTQTSTTLQDTSKSWTTDQFAGHIVRTTGGTGANRWRKVVSNTSNTLTVTPAWDTTPDGTTTYEITAVSSRLVAPDSRIYLAIAQVDFGKPDSSDTTYGVRIDKNGVYETVKFKSTAANTEHGISLVYPIELEEDDYIEFQVWMGGSSSDRAFYGSSRMLLSLVG